VDGRGEENYASRLFMTGKGETLLGLRSATVSSETGGEPMEIDPVCGMEVDPQTVAGTFQHQGKTYYFCSQGCLEDFKEDPESFIG